MEEVIVLVEEYEALNALRHKPWIQVRLMDIDRTVRKLSRPHRTAVLLCGIVGLTTRSAGLLVGESKSTMNRRYRRGMMEILTKLNGG
jgi:DNA-directed RNA polymerase specialized sigma24 family protein